jgi:effector-binding domain-containing protein
MVETELDLEEPFIKGELEGWEGVKITHTGSYLHLGNGWAAAMGYARAKEIKTKKSPVGIEYYLNDSSVTPKDDLITEIVLPLK